MLAPFPPACQGVRTLLFTCVHFGKKHRTSVGTFELNLGYAANSSMRISLIVAPPCGSDSSQAPVQRRLILTPNKYRKSAVRPSAMGELQGANTKSSKNRSNKKETAHTTHNFHFMSSVAISVHCCLHWCSHRHLASVLAPCIYPGVRTLSFTCVPSI